MKPPILITGCARSGTSMTAGMISRCGAFGGNTYGANNWNKKGMYENMEMRENILKPFLLLCGADPKGQKPLPDINRLIALDNLAQKVESIYKFQGYQKGPWYYKGAKMCLVWPAFHEAFPDAYWIIVRRKDEDIVNSCMKTSFMNGYKNPEGWQGWIDAHKKRFMEMKENGLNVVELWPSKCVKGNFEPLKEVLDHVGLRLNEKAVKEFVSPEMWRTKDGK